MNDLTTGFLLTLLTVLFVFGVMKLFSTHPRTEERIQRLQGPVDIR